MEIIDFEENCQDEVQNNRNLQEFTKKTLKFRSMDELNKTFLKGITDQDSCLNVVQRKVVKQSTQLCQGFRFPSAKLYSLKENQINRVTSQNEDLEQIYRKGRIRHKKLTIQKKLKDCDMWNGAGVARLKQGEVIFATWKNGLAIGQVKIVYPSGNIYIGGVKDNIRHGYGVFMFKNGDRFEGQFKDGSIEGYGVLYDFGGEIRESGLWKDGRIIQRTS